MWAARRTRIETIRIANNAKITTQAAGVTYKTMPTANAVGDSA
jgi:hypothetical protein